MKALYTCGKYHASVLGPHYSWRSGDMVSFLREKTLHFQASFEMIFAIEDLKFRETFDRK